MVDRLRLLANRPIQDGDRVRLFATVVALIVGAAALLAFLDDPDTTAPRTAPPSATTESAVEQPSGPPPSMRAPATLVAPSEESDPPTTQRPRVADVAHSKRAARRFLRQFLAFSYGRTPASTITAASLEVRAKLDQARPRVPAEERRRHARVELLQSDGVSRERADLSAVITDGERRYTMRLQLANTATGWLVTALER
ncbi:hypothetical protein OJ998_30120 [Solirubrobacter taibaiensis]|nr:hypothetical protein [Solirubrobacter taibaiensis]